jgi:hypothetical protein
MNYYKIGIRIESWLANHLGFLKNKGNSELNEVASDEGMNLRVSQAYERGNRPMGK